MFGRQKHVKCWVVSQQSARVGATYMSQFLVFKIFGDIN